MKLIKKPKLPKKMYKILFDTYNWGYDDSDKKRERITFEQLRESVKAGYERGLSKRKP